MEKEYKNKQMATAPNEKGQEVEPIETKDELADGQKSYFFPGGNEHQSVTIRAKDIDEARERYEVLKKRLII